MTKNIISLEGGCCVCGSAHPGHWGSYGDKMSLLVLCLVSSSQETSGQSSIACWLLLLGGFTSSGPRPRPQVFWA